VECGEIAQVAKKPPEGRMCRECAKFKNKTGPKPKAKEDLIRHTHVCEGCGRVRVSKAKAKGPLCGDCSRRKIGKANKKDAPVRYIRICPECPEDNNTREVTVKANSGIKLCSKHKKVPKGKDRKHVDDYRPRTKHVKLASPAAIKIAQQINREHKEAVANRVGEEEIVQHKTDGEMLDEFFEHNKPSIEFLNEPIPYSSCKTGSCSSTSVLGA